MPELPEVQTISSQLDPLVRGQRITAVQVLDPKCAGQDLAALKGWRVSGARRLGKQVGLELRRGGGRRWLAVHLRMTGRLLWQPGGGPWERPHLRALFELERGALLFVDVRRFGTLRYSADRTSLLPAGLDPMTPAFNARALGKLLAESRQELKVWLLRQDRLVGLGNIYACEILFRARLSPWRKAGTLSVSEVAALRRATREVLERAVENCGTTFSDFQDASGNVGGYQRYLQVYGREGEICKRCKGVVERVVQQGRSTFFCVSCVHAQGPPPREKGRLKQAR